MAHQAGARRQGGAGGSFFVESRKGELKEIRRLLGDMKVQRDPKKLREVVKKVISYMTQGIDVSSLFDTMITLSYTKDIVLKKVGLGGEAGGGWRGGGWGQGGGGA